MLDSPKSDNPLDLLDEIDELLAERPIEYQTSVNNSVVEAVDDGCTLLDTIWSQLPVNKRIAKSHEQFTVNIEWVSLMLDGSVMFKGTQKSKNALSKGSFFSGTVHPSVFEQFGEMRVSQVWTFQQVTNRYLIYYLLLLNAT